MSTPVIIAEFGPDGGSPVITVKNGPKDQRACLALTKEYVEALGKAKEVKLTPGATVQEVKQQQQLRA